MDNGMKKPAQAPEDLQCAFVPLANAGNVEGLVALYEPDALLAIPDGKVAIGAEAIRAVYAELLANRPQFEPGEHQPVLRHGNLALTSSRLKDGTVTAEVARKQPDGTWLWAIDQPSIAKSVVKSA